MNKQTMLFGMSQADLESAKQQLGDKIAGKDIPMQPIHHNVDRALGNIEQLKKDFYTLSSEEFKACLEHAFEHGWRMRMNRKTSECKETMDNCLTMMFLTIDKAMGKITVD